MESKQKEDIMNKTVAGWEVREGKLYRHFAFADFTQAWKFMSQVALLAEKMNHHPNWSNNYNHVDISLFSHDAGAITDKDYALAEAINSLAQ